MARVRQSRLAENDLLEIWLFIADDSANAADRFLDLLAEKCQRLADSPEIGRRRKDLGPGVRSFPVGNYIIFYRVADDGIEVVRVLSSYRDQASLFT